MAWKIPQHSLGDRSAFLLLNNWADRPVPSCLSPNSPEEGRQFCPPAGIHAHPEGGVLQDAGFPTQQPLEPVQPYPQTHSTLTDTVQALLILAYRGKNTPERPRPIALCPRAGTVSGSRQLFLPVAHYPF